MADTQAEPTSPGGVGTLARTWIWIFALFGLLLIVLTIEPGWTAVFGANPQRFLAAVSVGSSLVLSAILVLICLVQTFSRQRQLEKLNSIETFIGAKVRYYAVARAPVVAMRR